MPVISRFNGIVIRMYFLSSEHNPPHLHAIYGDDVAAIDFQTDEILDGYLPPKTMELVLQWISLHRDELLQIWETQNFIKIPPL
ncbi:DUF4160 domain-containing protein [Butyrivibrio fibrisolvens]|uniref:DUF4160 domain-containing protein n=1 Tax=Pseudobutyrivibrio TaxID=46205 RepID=UPI0004823E89|nr:MULTISPECIES: DUF4160 domain-containing protein [Pseudobutyrivibrio]MDC7279854.1 DUF4160 domain-containing protein [Butyrivibrio fibrisolvens]SFN60626.1 protein of unknown function [Pseudobutyrivibrio sp. UC1225]